LTLLLINAQTFFSLNCWSTSWTPKRWPTVKVKTRQTINQQNKSIMQQVGVKFYICNIVAWKPYYNALANAQKAQITYNFKDTKEKLLKYP
jgi:hypothetical protein